jgi:cyclopropane fatty-acyl-phospholipid synthase-like methyltransferase
MEKLYFEIYENIPRQGPGDINLTGNLYSKLKNLPENPQILDIGCGKGIQTIELAKHTNGSITAVDNHQYFLDCLKEDAQKLQLDKKITCIQADMNDLPFDDKSFDLIWSEGAIFIMGIKDGLRKWKKLVKKDGYLLFSDLVWKKEPCSLELIEYWNQEYPSIMNIDEVILESQLNDFEVISHYTLPKISWINNYLIPIENIIAKLKVKNRDNAAALEIYKTCEKENEMVRKYYDTFVYEYFILKLK